MSIAIDLTRLVAYSDHERAKWKSWVAADPARLATPFQNGGRFPTLGNLLDHIFLIEARHLSRLQGSALPESTGVTAGDWPALFAYADTVRANLSAFVVALDEQAANESITFKIPSGAFTLTRRKLTLHILLHEVRHLAQIAYAVRAAGYEPPGEHDVFFFPGF
ncbi:MAG TPA: DinB family protein [Vicinamibacterales bacterium]|nr:DinB family protein [Vicinamibacterales bacterium]